MLSGRGALLFEVGYRKGYSEAIDDSEECLGGSRKIAMLDVPIEEVPMLKARGLLWRSKVGLVLEELDHRWSTAIGKRHILSLSCSRSWAVEGQLP